MELSPAGLLLETDERGVGERSFVGERAESVVKSAVCDDGRWSSVVVCTAI